MTHQPTNKLIKFMTLLRTPPQDITPSQLQTMSHIAQPNTIPHEWLENSPSQGLEAAKKNKYLISHANSPL
jgi:hypothetical protein